METGAQLTILKHSTEVNSEKKSLFKIHNMSVLHNYCQVEFKRKTSAYMLHRRNKQACLVLAKRRVG